MEDINRRPRLYQNIWGNPKIGVGTRISSFVEIGSSIDYPTSIGKDCSIQSFVFICPGITIEDKVFIAPSVTFTNDRKPPSYGKDWAKTIVKRGASIGANSVIVAGVTIGERSIIGAGSVVTKSVPDGKVWVGNPARLLTKSKKG